MSQSRGKEATVTRRRPLKGVSSTEVLEFIRSKLRSLDSRRSEPHLVSEPCSGPSKKCESCSMVLRGCPKGEAGEQLRRNSETETQALGTDSLYDTH